MWLREPLILIQAIGPAIGGVNCANKGMQKPSFQCFEHHDTSSTVQMEDHCYLAQNIEKMKQNYCLK
jgi:hypothetical protein